MGDRASVSFKNTDGMESVTLFDHWGGRRFHQEAQEYADKLIQEKAGDKRIRGPLDRLEAQTVMVDFIRYLTKDMDRVESGLHLGIDAQDGDNSDQGHKTILLSHKE